MPRNLEQVLKEAIIARGLIPDNDLETILKETSSTKESFLSVLLRKKLFTKEQCLSVLSEEFNLPTLDLKQIKFEPAAAQKVPARIAFYYKFVPVKLVDRVLTIAVLAPLDVMTQDQIRTLLGFDIEMVLALEDEVTEGLKKVYGLGADTLGKIDAPELQDSKTQESIENIEELAEEASVIKLVNQIIFEAYKKRATDIHIEPYRGEVSIRYRIDGVLYDANVPKKIKEFILPIISRIKIMSNLNIVEKRLPQDGRAVVKTQDQTLDLRISTLPTPYGESMVIRILPTKMLFSLQRLGLSSSDQKIFEELISKPYGVIFITGPTGSGKSTTLYTCLSKLNTRDRKIITIEDPIEYELKGITQIQVMQEISFTFAKGLRSILRHDPDIIMVGEVRDLETAEIVVRVALTGHLVFSTLHTNDAPSGITRLVDIGIDPYLISSIAQSFIAQRLIRVICPNCKTENKNIPLELKQRIADSLELESTDEVKAFVGSGCEDCNLTGFSGRTGIYEIFIINRVIKDLIGKNVQSDELKKVAISQGMRTLEQDGWQKVIDGVTTPSEVMRVVSGEVRTSSKSSMPYDKSTLALENRRYPRLNTLVNIHYHILKSKEELVKRGYTLEKFSTTKNIGAGGISFSVNNPINVGAMLELTLELPDGKEKIVCLAKLSWVRESIDDQFRVGVCFFDLTTAERKRIKSFIDEELKD